MASLAAETTGGQILVAFLPKHGLRSDLRVPNLTKFSWGGIPPDPPSFFTLMHTLIRNQWPYQFKIAGSGPVCRRTACSRVALAHRCQCARLTVSTN